MAEQQDTGRQDTEEQREQGPRSATELAWLGGDDLDD